MTPSPPMIRAVLAVQVFLWNHLPFFGSRSAPNSRRSLVILAIPSFGPCLLEPSSLINSKSDLAVVLYFGNLRGIFPHIPSKVIQRRKVQKSDFLDRQRPWATCENKRTHPTATTSPILCHELVKSIQQLYLSVVCFDMGICIVCVYQAAIQQLADNVLRNIWVER